MNLSLKENKKAWCTETWHSPELSKSFNASAAPGELILRKVLKLTEITELNIYSTENVFPARSNAFVPAISIYDSTSNPSKSPSSIFVFNRRSFGKKTVSLYSSKTAPRYSFTRASGFFRQWKLVQVWHAQHIFTDPRRAFNSLPR